MMLEEMYDDLLGDVQPIEEDENQGPLFMDDETNEVDDNVENDFVSQTLPQSDNTVQPKKKKVVKNPQPKLNAERLKGPRGIAILEKVFADYKFLGKGYEREDLNQIMKRLEHWAHRLYPRYQFDDCLEKIEVLGHKKLVSIYVKKIRLGMETVDSALVEEEKEDELKESENELAVPLDPFDDLISQSLSEVYEKPKSSSPPKKLSLTDEQRARMERNRQMALERKLARMKQLEGQIAECQNAKSVSGVNAESVHAESVNAEVVNVETVHAEIVIAGSVNAEGVNVESVNAEGVNAESVNAEHVITESVHAEGVITESVHAEGVVTESVHAEGVVTESVHAEGVITESVHAEGVITESVHAEGVITESVHAEGVITESVHAEGVITESVRAEGVITENVHAKGVNSECVNADSQNIKNVNTESENTENQNTFLY